ncbi:MAG: Ppx/GppA family phosphatase [Hyphomicrobiaceae bacterium]|nr:MAG: Ppx/GppA family phosphatase [Hyphomicrobiaceae bacterium]
MHSAHRQGRIQGLCPDETRLAPREGFTEFLKLTTVKRKDQPVCSLMGAPRRFLRSSPFNRARAVVCAKRRSDQALGSDVHGPSHRNGIGGENPPSGTASEGAADMAVSPPGKAIAPAASQAPATATPPANVAKSPRQAAVRSGAGRNTYAGTTYGALDLGTNNCRLLVARPSRRGFVVMDAFSRIIRLGEGVSRTGVLSEAAMARTLEALNVCASKLARQKVDRSRLIATEACRVAENGAEFIERVRRQTGLKIEIVTRETEARLAVSGCASLIDANSDLALVFDIGGGSSELIWLDLAGHRVRPRRSLEDRLGVQSAIAAWTSISVGVVTLAERFGGRHVSTGTFEAMVREVSGRLEEFELRHPFRERLKSSNAHLIGTSGTVTTVAGVQLGLPRYNRNRVDGCWLSSDDVRRVTGLLLAMSYERRTQEPCVGMERADLVLAGCAILEAILRMWPAPRLRVADRGLREGILATLMAEDDYARDGRSWPLAQGPAA